MWFSKILIKYWWFIILLAVSAYFLISSIVSNASITSQKVFSVSNIQDITRIQIDEFENSIVLERLDQHNWTVNGSFTANRKAVETLLLVLNRIQSAGPVPLFANDSLASVLNRSSINVDVFAKHWVMKSFKLMPTTISSMHIVGLLRGANSVQKLEIPAANIDLISVFSSSVASWRTNQILLPSINSINAIEVEIPSKQELSFRVDILEDESLRLFNLQNGITISQFDSLKVREFLSQFENISYSQIVTISPEERAAIIYSEPDYIYTIYTKQGKNHQVKIFPIPVQERLDEFGRPIRYDLNRLYLTHSNDQEVYIVSYIDIHILLQNISDFKLSKSIAKTRKIK
jgi:hypothetical protein